jgi:uncharacterized protein YqiB (DUF1249 family)
VSFFPSKTSVNKHKAKYQPNLVSLMTLCANNYMLLLKVLAGNTDVDQARNFFISDFLSYSVTINEVTRYTSLVTFKQESLPINVGEEMALQLQHALYPRMSIRLYHDARMAEVLSTQDIRQVKPRYDYPNNQMHQQDEKQQINQFLNEWLHLCLQLGQVKLAI